MRSFCLLCFECSDFLLSEGREDLDVACCIGIIDVEPELVEGVRARTCWVKPYIATLGLAKLSTIGLSNQWADESKGFPSLSATDELSTRSDVSPLV